MSWSRWKLLPLECALGSRISHWPLPGSLAVFGIKASYIIHVPATFSLLSVISVISLLSELTDISPKRQVISSPNILRQFSMRNCMKEICNTKGQKMGYYFTYGVIVYHISSMNLGSNKQCKRSLRKIQTWLKYIYIYIIYIYIYNIYIYYIYIHQLFLRNNWYFQEYFGLKF